MSRIGRLPITVPGGVDIALDGNDVTPASLLDAMACAQAARLTTQVARPDLPRF